MSVRRNVEYLPHYKNMRELLINSHNASLSPTNKRLFKEILEVLDLSVDFIVGDTDEDHFSEEVYNTVS